MGLLSVREFMEGVETMRAAREQELARLEERVWHSDRRPLSSPGGSGGVTTVVPTGALPTRPTSTLSAISGSDSGSLARVDPWKFQERWYRTIGRGVVFLRPLLERMSLQVRTRVFMPRSSERLWVTVSLEVLDDSTPVSEDEVCLGEFTSRARGRSFIRDLSGPKSNETAAPQEDNTPVSPTGALAVVDAENEVVGPEATADGEKPTLRFRVTVVQCEGVRQSDYREVFCFVRFACPAGESFSTEPKQPSDAGLLTFNFSRSFSAKMDADFTAFLEHGALYVDLNGHCAEHSLQTDSELDAFDFSSPRKVRVMV